MKEEAYHLREASPVPASFSFSRPSFTFFTPEPLHFWADPTIIISSFLFPSFSPLFFFLVKPFRPCHCACCCCSCCPRFRPPELIGRLPEATASLPFVARPPETPPLAGKPPLKPTWSFLLRSDFRWSSGDKRGTKSKLFTCILIFLIQF